MSGIEILAAKRAIAKVNRAVDRAKDATRLGAQIFQYVDLAECRPGSAPVRPWTINGGTEDTELHRTGVLAGHIEGVTSQRLSQAVPRHGRRRPCKSDPLTPAGKTHPGTRTLFIIGGHQDAASDHVVVSEVARLPDQELVDAREAERKRNGRLRTV